MTLFTQIKTDQLFARKQRNKIHASVLGTLIGEAETLAKNASVESISDMEMQALIKKFLKNINELLKVAEPGSDSVVTAETEKALLTGYLPAQLSEEELRVIIQKMIDVDNLTGNKGFGILMKTLKTEYEGKYDGALAVKIAKELTV